MKKHTIIVACLLSLGATACSSTKPCEDILEVKRQERVCMDLSRVMNDNSRPQQAMTARKRYEVECENLRYYRDDYDTICMGDQKPVGQKQEKPE